MISPVQCRLLRSGEPCDQFVVNVPADLAAATALLHHHFAGAMRALDAEPEQRRAYRLRVETLDGRHLYDLEATP